MEHDSVSVLLGVRGYSMMVGKGTSTFSDMTMIRKPELILNLKLTGLASASELANFTPYLMASGAKMLQPIMTVVALTVTTISYSATGVLTRKVALLVVVSWKLVTMDVQFVHFLRETAD